MKTLLDAIASPKKPDEEVIQMISRLDEDTLNFTISAYVRKNPDGTDADDDRHIALISKQEVSDNLLQGWSALHEAVAVKRPAVVHALLKAGIDPNIVNKARETALWEAVRNDDAPMIDLLCEGFCDPNYLAADKWVPLMQAARDGQVECVRALIEGGALVMDHVDVMGRDCLGLIDMGLNPPDIPAPKDMPLELLAYACEARSKKDPKRLKECRKMCEKALREQEAVLADMGEDDDEEMTPEQAEAFLQQMRDAAAKLPKMNWKSGFYEGDKKKKSKRR